MTNPILLAVYIILFPGFCVSLLGTLWSSSPWTGGLWRKMQNRGRRSFSRSQTSSRPSGKEVIDPEGVDRPIFDAAPVVGLAAVMTAFLYIPVIGGSPLAFEGDLVLVLYLLTLPTLALLLLGGPSRNVYAAVGGIRAVTMLFIYEVPFFLALMPTLMAVLFVWGSWRQQQHPARPPTADRVRHRADRAPGEWTGTLFDIPEAETEVVAGPDELTGRRLALMHLANQSAAVAGSALIAAVFLGGPSLPWTITPPARGARWGSSSSSPRHWPSSWCSRLSGG